MLAKPSGSDNDCIVKLTVSVRVDCPFTEPETRRRGGGPRPKTAAEKIAHFWARVQRGAPDACWLWQGGRFKSGYGQVALGNRIPGLAHRIAYQLTRGSIPDGLVVRHKCDTPLCCNPSHLEIGTQADNLQDARDRGRLDESKQRPGAWTIPPGARERVIAEAIRGPRGTIARLAREHNVSIQHISVAVHRARRHRLPLLRSA